MRDVDVDVDVDVVVVVIPARDEQDGVEAAVDAVLASVVAVAVTHPSVRVDVVVVADGCRDATASLARSAGAAVVEIDAANVGTARRVGCEWAFGRTSAPDRLWIATTDADSIVPEGWLPAQLEAARHADVFLGTIGLTELDRGLHPRWGADYAVRADGGSHGHVHGASLGVRGDAYLEAGGFHDLPAHEDADLVGRLVARGAAPVWDDRVPVTTSARHVSRVTEGVGADLAASLVTPVDLGSACMKPALPGM